jgi:hypothetical protein
LEQLGGKRTGCSTLMWCVPMWVKLAPMDGGFSQFLGGLGGGLDSCNGYGLSVWVFGWCVWMMGGGALGRAKDYPLLWVVEWRWHGRMGCLGNFLFSFFVFSLDGSRLGCLEVGGF